MGDAYWQPEIIKPDLVPGRTQAVCRFPVRVTGGAASFRGRVSNAMWTDMSEIVRPTPRRIHWPRIYQYHLFELSRKTHAPSPFDEKGALPRSLPEIAEIPIPVVLQPPTFGGC